MAQRCPSGSSYFMAIRKNVEKSVVCELGSAEKRPVEENRKKSICHILKHFILWHTWHHFTWKKAQLEMYKTSMQSASMQVPYSVKSSFHPSEEHFILSRGYYMYFCNKISLRSFLNWGMAFKTENQRYTENFWFYVPSLTQQKRGCLLTQPFFLAWYCSTKTATNALLGICVHVLTCVKANMISCVLCCQAKDIAAKKW